MLSLLNAHKIIVIDEAPRIPGIGLLIKRMVDAHSECKIYVTGSNLLDLTDGVYENAVGRTRSNYLWRFSFKELADASSLIQEQRPLFRTSVRKLPTGGKRTISGNRKPEQSL